jgi:hypothetical protein
MPVLPFSFHVPQDNTPQLSTIAYRVGEFVEHAIDHSIAGSALEAPLLEEGAPAAPDTWYRKLLPEGMCGDGSPYHIYLRKGSSDHLCIFLSGGGIAWNPYTAARPVTGGRTAAWLPNYYWENLRPFTQIMNIHNGITATLEAINPFHDWNFLVITYSTGDMHLGDGEIVYNPLADDSALTGYRPEEEILHFHGRKNFLSAMEACRAFFPDPDKLLIAGDSAGAFAVPAVAEEIADTFYPGVSDITLLSDSAQLYYGKWRHVLRKVWNTEKTRWKDVNGACLALEWYRALYQRNGKRFRCLYAGSTRDYLLSAFYSDMHYKEYRTDASLQSLYFRQMRRMVRDLKKLDPDFGIFVYDFRHPSLAGGGTIHTAVRQPAFFLKASSGVSMAYWLSQAVEGNVFDAGLELLRLPGTGKAEKDPQQEKEEAEETSG